ncbi:MAG: DsbE family thiol:disulfide interchange protein [Kiloniellales bacterium]|nr:DsbE family thiol:disulfide interchange protein [Kiloniellales bacterium]
MTQRLLFLLPALVFAVIAGYFLWGLTDPDHNPRQVPSALVGKPVPDFDLPPVAGVEVPGLATADLAEGPVTLVNFFASWCVPCRAEHPIFMRLAEEGRVRMVGINYRDKPEDAATWLAELGNPYERIGADAKARAGIDWGVSGVPETFVVDRAGQIRYQHIGPILPKDLEQTLLPLIEGLSQ